MLSKYAWLGFFAEYSESELSSSLEEKDAENTKTDTKSAELYYIRGVSDRTGTRFRQPTDMTKTNLSATLEKFFPETSKQNKISQIIKNDKTIIELGCHKIS